MNIADIRKDYSMQALDVASVQPDPLVQFQQWLDAAISAQNPEPTAMSLATVNDAGQPACRMVLLKGVDAQGLHFFTNYESRKGQDIASNSLAALCFWWPELERQVRVEGRAMKLSQEESYAYYATRPLPSRLGAWASPQSQVLPNREALDELQAKTAAQFREIQDVPLPPFWGGYRIIPISLEFWQGRPSRLHDRIRYRREKDTDSWIIERLAP